MYLWLLGGGGGGDEELTFTLNGGVLARNCPLARRGKVLCFYSSSIPMEGVRSVAG